MGVPKQKWTSKEEDALKARIPKYRPGIWSTILKDSEFISVLHTRSNVDFKDKWRNMNFKGSGYGSRQRSRSAKSQPIYKPEEEHDMQISIVNPLPTLSPPLQNDASKMPMANPRRSIESQKIDAELENMKKMTCQKATAFAVKAVAEAKATIYEAEVVAKEAEVAEADAELAKVFAMRERRKPHFGL
ncbi:hypothetical protein L1887_38184 [Cichorium endivia]|nr:hypothetical protein L1887_38184 [Cichorium endivia]